MSDKPQRKSRSTAKPSSTSSTSNAPKTPKERAEDSQDQDTKPNTTPNPRDSQPPDTSQTPLATEPGQTTPSRSNAPIHRDTTNTPRATLAFDTSQEPDATQPAPASTAARHTPLADTTTNADTQGDVTLCSADSSGDMPAEWLELLNLARARDGETRKQCWERLRQEGRTAGMTRRDAISYAGRAVDHVWIAPVIPEPEPSPEPETLEIPEPAPEPEPAPTIVDKPSPADDGVPGLGELPAGWPTLPANASLQAEISWVSANRLRVRNGSGVDLSRALSPAPSYSALSWLETSILFPSKFADISVKATANQDDEREAIRREKASIEEVRAILKEMLED